MNQPIRVLFADNSSVVRKILTVVFEKHPEISVVGTADDGTTAIQEFNQQKPDVVVLDIELPGLNGLEVTKAIHALDPDTAIIMFSSLTTKYAASTLTALSNGACDYETKPPMTGHVGKIQKSIEETLLPKVLRWGRHNAEIRSQGIPTVDEGLFENRERTSKRIPEIVTVGVSTGGPDSLGDFLSVFPRDFSLPIVVVQHMPPVFTRILAERLTSSSSLEVCEAQQGMELSPGKVILAPGDFHMQVKRFGDRAVVKVDQEPMINFCRPSVDRLFFSVHEHYHRNCIAVVLTGMGKDGLEGCRRIHDAGGVVMAQDKESSVIWGMPGSVCNAGLASMIAPPQSLARHVLRAATSRHQVPVG